MSRRALAAAVALACAAAAPARAEPTGKRKVAVLEYRGGSDAVTEIAAQATRILRKQTSLRIIDADDARVEKGGRVDEAIAKCSGAPECVAGIGRALGVREVLLIGVSEFGDVILTLQRIDVRNRKVVARVAEALAPGAEPDDDAVAEYLRRVLPRTDFVRYGTIHIDADVDGAAVTVGGQPRGVTPVAPIRVLAPATYDIAVEKSGYVGFRVSVDVPPDGVMRVDASLRRDADVWYKKWWVGAIAAGVVAGAITVAVVASQDDPTELPVSVTW